MFYSIFNFELSDAHSVEEVIEKIDMVKKSTTYNFSKNVGKKIMKKAIKKSSCIGKKKK